MPAFDIATVNKPPRQVFVSGEHATIGRDPSCEICLDDAGASRRHARVVRAKSGRYMVEDLGSKNGTRVNGAVIRNWELENGDEVVIGTSRLRFFYEAKPEQRSVIVTPDEDETNDNTLVASAATKPQLSAVRLNLLYELSDRLTRLRDQEELLHDVMDICVETFGFDRSVIALIEKDPDNPVWAYKYNRTGGEELVISQSLLRRVLREGDRVILKDPMMGTASPTVSMVQAGIRSAMCAPIRFQDQTLGAIYGDRVTSAREYTQEELDFLAAIATQLSVGLTNAKLLEEHRGKIRMEGELLLAREIQRGLFPSELPKGNKLQVAAVNEPGLEVSGDYYDVIPMTADRVAVVVGDVTGKGAAAAILMGNLQSAVRLMTVDNARLDELVTEWNRLICRNTQPSKFITTVLVMIDAQTRQMQYCNAGHLAPAVIGPQGVQYFPEPSGMPIGVSPEWRYEVGTIALPAGPQSLLLYSDGVTEAMNPESELFSTERLTQTLSEGHWSTADELINLVAEAVARFRGLARRSDDLTMLAVHLPE